MRKHLSLEQRISRLERIISEKSSVRSHAPSKAFLVWKFLSDHLGADREVIKASFPEDEQVSISSVLLDCMENGIIRMVGDKYFANKNYEWDDVGVWDEQDQENLIDDLEYLIDRVK